jgi:tetratricopeptide (TPR) repeat protein
MILSVGQMRRGRQLVAGLVLAAIGPAGLTLLGCRVRAPAPSQAPPPAAAAAPAPKPAAPAAAATNDPPTRPLRRCFSDQPAWMDAPVGSLLDRAADLFDAGDYTGALACAEEAARQAPRSVEAHHNRAIALMRLDRADEARDALALALALSPDDVETLEAAADLNINQLPPSSDRSALGLEYARRGSRRAPRHDRERAGRLALLEGQALIDLGRANEALRRIDAALAASPRLTAAVYERGVALFELCRFDDARRAFEKVLAATPDHAHALYHLGLIEERLSDDAGSARHLAAARTADPKAFPPAPEIDAADFAARVQRATAALPEDVRRDLTGIDIEAAELPDITDLTAEKPPLSPTILGLFRGLPLDYSEHASAPTPAGRAGKGRPQPTPPVAGPDVGAGGRAGERCDSEDRAIVLYRRNLLRTVRDGAELDQAITRTLLHEVGHLRGEDDGSLRDRGLE